MQTYFTDKAQIFLYQKPEDTFILGEQVTPFIKEYGYEKKISAQTTVAGAKNVPKSWKLQILGEHNRYNTGLAVVAAEALGVDTDIVHEAVGSFAGVEGRLQLVRQIGSIKIYNDTTATTPEATIAALEALDPDKKKNILLIMGGADKGLAMDELQSSAHTHAKQVFFLAGSGTDRVRNKEPLFNSINEALDAAYKAAEEGDVILMSPAFASFGMFKNEFDRGEQFIEAVKNL